jgi:hypothetical protein
MPPSRGIGIARPDARGSTRPRAARSLAARLDVVEAGDDHAPGRQRGLGNPQLPQQRPDRVLLVLGRGAADKRDRQQRRLASSSGPGPTAPRPRDCRTGTGVGRGQVAFAVEPRPDRLRRLFRATHSSTSVITAACAIRSRSPSAPSTVRTSASIATGPALGHHSPGRPPPRRSTPLPGDAWDPPCWPHRRPAAARACTSCEPGSLRVDWRSHRPEAPVRGAERCRRRR